MPVSAILKLLLPGMLPLLVYVVASEVWGDLVGLCVGVVLGLAEFFYLWIRQKRVDGFVLLDTGLLVAAGVVSLALSDALFFRLKPVIMETLLVALLAWSAFGPNNLILAMAFRGQTGEALRQSLQQRPQVARQMRLRMTLLTAVFGAHTGLALASALWMDKESWAFITGVLPLILAGVISAGFLVWSRRRV